MTSSAPMFASQLTSNPVDADPPFGTFTSRGFCPSTLQLPATPVSSTEWVPAASPLNVTVPSDARAFDCVPSTVTV